MSREELYLRVNRFWDTNKHVTRDKRSQLAQSFIDELLSEGELMQWKVQNEKIRHPMIRRKDPRKKYTVLDILADFIINAKMSDEKKQEYPVKNAEVEFYWEKKRENNEVQYVEDPYNGIEENN